MADTTVLEPTQETAGNTVVAEGQVQTKTETKAKAKDKSSGNLILDVAQEVEGLTKTKALNLAETLAENIELNYFRLGGVLSLINDNSWFEGFATFEDFVFEKYGFQGRKARYLISIYDNLVTKQIPWDKVSHLGWTKLKDLAPILNLDNVDEWVAKATPVTVLELQAMLKAGAEGGDKSTKTKSDTVTVKFTFKTDQVDIVTQALAKAKGELHTEFDSVAMENICSSYVGGTTALVKQYSLDDVINNTGFDTIMGRIAEMFPQYDISVSEAGAVQDKAPEQVATETAAATS